MLAIGVASSSTELNSSDKINGETTTQNRAWQNRIGPLPPGRTGFAGAKSM